MQYARGDDADLWLSLADIREQLPKSNWRHSRVYEDANIAADIGLPLSEFWSWPETDRAYLIARKRVAATMEGYDALLREKEMKRQSRMNKRKR